MVFKHLQAFSFALKGRKINKKSTDARKSNKSITNTDKNISLMFVNVVPLVPLTEMHKIHPITTRYTLIQRTESAHVRSTYTGQF